MKSFAYKAYRKDGVLEEGVIKSASLSDARRSLMTKGLMPYETSQIVGLSPSPSKRFQLFRSGLSLNDYAEIFQHIAVLVRADIPVDQSLLLLQSQSRSKRVSRLVGEIQRLIEGGSSLSEALAHAANDAPPILTNLLTAGEARGNLGDALQQCAHYLIRQRDIQRKISSALTYPLLLMVTATVVTALIVTALVPAILPLFEENNVEPPFGLQIANFALIAFTEYWHLLIVAAGVLILVYFLLSRLEGVRLFLARLKLRMPFLGPLARDIEIANIARTVGTLLGSGVQLVQALRLAASVSTNVAFKKYFEEIAEQVRLGQSLVSTIRTSDLLSAIAIQFITIGEKSSQLDRMFLQLAEMTEADTERRIEESLVLLGPLLTIIIAVLVGGLILSVMQSILSVNQLVFR